MRFVDLVDLGVMQRLCDGFAAVTGTTTVLMDLDGRWLASSKFRSVCSLFHRACDGTEARCRQSDAALAGALDAGEPYGIHRCLNGLIDVAVPIVVGGERVASFYAGQFFLDPPDASFFDAQAASFGFDAAAYRAAVAEVPIIPRERVRPIMDFFSELARVMGELGLVQSQLEQASRATAASEALLRTVTDASPELVFLKDTAGRWQFANPAALAFFDRTREEVLGRTDDEVFDDGEAAAVIRRVDEEVMSRGVRRVVEVRIRTRRGERILLASKAPHRDLDGNVVGLVGNASDITEHHQLEDQMREAQRLDSLGRLAGGVAHDFNNLLTVILGCAEAMRLDVQEGLPASTEDLADIESAAHRARDLTRQLLAFARKQVIAPVPLDLNAAVTEAEKLLRRVLGEDVELVVRTAPGPVPVRCDPGQLEQVLVNLAVNARDAMPRGGRLTVETGVASELPADVARPGDPAAWGRLRVADTGCGMPPQIKDKLFEPFFTTKGLGKGTGLGLATVHGIVSQSGGRVRVESEPGRGACFDIYLPWTDEPCASAAAPSTAALKRGSESLLVIEDDERVRHMAARALRSGGYQVLVAADAAEAATLASGRSVDLVISDVVMPGPDGRAAVDALRRTSPGLKALFVSGYSEDRIERHGVLEPGIEFLAKPFTAAELLARVRSLLDRA